MNDIITIKTGRTNGYLFTIANSPEGRTFIEGFRKLRRASGEPNVSLRGRNPNRKQFIGALNLNSRTGATYTSDDLRQSLPLRFATSFDVYIDR